MAAEAMTEEGMNEALYAAAEAGDAAEVASLLDSGASANQQHNVSFWGPDCAVLPRGGTRNVARLQGHGH